MTVKKCSLKTTNKDAVKMYHYIKCISTGLGYGGFLGGLYSGHGYGYGYGGHFPHHSYYGSRLYYNPIHGLHSHDSIHHHDTPIY